MENIFELCESCYKPVNINEMIVKGTADGDCIYCPKCVECHKILDEQADLLCKNGVLTLKRIKISSYTFYFFFYILKYIYKDPINSLFFLQTTV